MFVFCEVETEFLYVCVIEKNILIQWINVIAKLKL